MSEDLVGGTTLVSCGSTPNPHSGVDSNPHSLNPDSNPDSNPDDDLTSCSSLAGSLSPDQDEIDRRNAEDDLANNNDPNNNAADQNVVDPDPIIDVGSANNEADMMFNVALEVLELEGRQEREEQLRKDVALITKLLADKTHDEVREKLEQHFDKPTRVQIVLNELLEQQMDENDPDDVSTSRPPTPEPTVKNKAGNGLKVKNRKRRSSNETYESHVTEKGLLIKKVSDEETTEKSKKRPLLDLNLESHPEISKEAAKEMTEQYKQRFEEEPDKGENDEPTPRPSIEEYDPLEGTSRAFLQKKTRKGSCKPKIELSEDHYHGPYVFNAHRPETRRSSSTATADKSKPSEKSFSAMRPDLKEIVEEHSGTLVTKSPELVDLVTPPVVDLSRADDSEKNQLFGSLVNMFPDTPRDYLAEQSVELAGKPAATERFIMELLGRDAKPPEDWVPGSNNFTLQMSEENTGLQQASDVVKFVDLSQQEVEEIVPSNAQDGDSNAGVEQQLQQQNVPETEEDKLEAKIATLQSLFPNTDPEFLHTRVVEFGENEEELNRWINEGLENKGINFPSRLEYEKRQQEAELMQTYSREVTVEEILVMYSDPEEYFSDKTRKVTDLYRKHALAQLKKEFRMLSVNAINAAFHNNRELYYPSFKELRKKGNTNGRRKTRRPDHECQVPQEIDINFLKELQFSRIEKQVKEYKDSILSAKKKKIEEARSNNKLVECGCCFNDECLMEDMLDCKGGHQYCEECVQRASEVAIGDGKMGLKCLGQCEENFELATLQRALKANMFSKWLRKIQLAEVEQADIDGLERCPYCEFATIMDTLPEENKIFKCLNPDCGKETCRLCKEFSHIPLRCDEVEKDSEVRKRTYIENKMTEALIRKCYKCKKPFLKTDGCNKMTCECGAKMCYLCRQPVKDYQHFYGQGGKPEAGRMCPLWSDNQTIHKNDVAKAALEAKSEMDEKNPEVMLKFDPTEGIKKPPENITGGPIDNAVLNDLIGADADNHRQFLDEQRRIERIIREGRRNVAHGFGPGAPWQDQNNRDWPDGFMDHMGQLLHLREVHRRRHRDLRRMEGAARQQIQIQRQQRDVVDARFQPDAQFPAAAAGRNEGIRIGAAMGHMPMPGPVPFMGGPPMMRAMNPNPFPPHPPAEDPFRQQPYPGQQQQLHPTAGMMFNPMPPLGLPPPRTIHLPPPVPRTVEGAPHPLPPPAHMTIPGRNNVRAPIVSIVNQQQMRQRQQVLPDPPELDAGEIAVLLGDPPVTAANQGHRRGQGPRVRHVNLGVNQSARPVHQNDRGRFRAPDYDADVDVEDWMM